MRAVVQRVSEASVQIDAKQVTSIKHGMLVLLGIEHEDNEQDADWLSGKLVRMRIFQDENDHMNLSVLDTQGEAIVVSQFTLHASTKKGNRPSFIKAAKPDKAQLLYQYFISIFEKQLGKPVGTGEFGAMMDVSLINDGPVTIIIDSKQKH
ncbi:MAG: D-aminoacyl-tRNA deacylase [Gilvibacter sp.]